MITTEEKIVYDWQYNLMGDFETVLMKVISKADSKNLEKLSKSFPDHVSAYKKFAHERGWWENIEKKRKHILRAKQAPRNNNYYIGG